MHFSKSTTLFGLLGLCPSVLFYFHCMLLDEQFYNLEIGWLQNDSYLVLSLKVFGVHFQ